MASTKRLVRERTGGWARARRSAGAINRLRIDGRGVTGAGGAVLWLCGARAPASHASAGRSIGSSGGRDDPRRSSTSTSSGSPAYPRPATRATMRRRRAISRRSGARTAPPARSVASQSASPPTARRYGRTGALLAAAVTVVRQHAGRDELTLRILLRGRGENWPEPGDPLRGLPPSRLLKVAGHPSSEAAALERAGIGDVRVDAEGRAPRPSPPRCRRLARHHGLTITACCHTASCSMRSPSRSSAAGRGERFAIWPIGGSGCRHRVVCRPPPSP